MNPDSSVGRAMDCNARGSWFNPQQNQFFLKGIGSRHSLQLSGRQKLLFDWNFKPRAFLGPSGPPLLGGSSIPLKSLLKPLSTYYAAQG